MTLENEIKSVIDKKLNDGTVEKLVEEYVEEGIKKALSSLFSSYGDITRVIEDKIKSVMLPYLEGYDYSEYIVKLDHVLTEVLKQTTKDNKEILSNFKDLMLPVDKDEKEIKLTDLFDKWCDYVEKNVDTSDLEVEFDDYPHYEDISVSVEVEENEIRSWSHFEHAIVYFECGKDDNVNFQIPISRYRYSNEKGWDIDYRTTRELASLRYLNSFEIYLMRLVQNNAKLIVDTHYDEVDIRPEAEPEASWA